jgi:hypothetical protein
MKTLEKINKKPGTKPGFFTYTNLTASSLVPLARYKILQVSKSFSKV